jgi:hypothetical protein
LHDQEKTAVTNNIIPLPSRRERWPSDALCFRLVELRRRVDRDLLGVRALIRNQQDTFDLLSVYLGGLEPKVAQGKYAGMMAAWSKLAALMESNAARAKAMRARRKGSHANYCIKAAALGPLKGGSGNDRP